MTRRKTCYAIVVGFFLGSILGCLGSPSAQAQAPVVVEVRTPTEFSVAVSRQERVDVRIMAPLDIGAFTIPAGPDLIIRQTVPTAHITWRSANPVGDWKTPQTNGININGRRNVMFSSVRFSDCQMGGAMIKGNPGGVVYLSNCRIEYVGDALFPYRPGATNPPSIADCWGTYCFSGEADWRISACKFYRVGTASRGGAVFYVKPTLSVTGCYIDQYGPCLVYMPQGTKCEIRDCVLKSGWTRNETVPYPMPPNVINGTAGMRVTFTHNNVRGVLSMIGTNADSLLWVCEQNNYSAISKWWQPNVGQIDGVWVNKDGWIAEGFDVNSQWPAP